MTNPSTRDLALMIDDLQRQVRTLQRTNGTARGSILGGAITAYDSDDEAALLIGEQWDGSVTTAELIGPIPPTPTKPTCQPGLTSIAVHWDGMFEPREDDDMVVAPMDFARVEIHASQDPDFTAEFADTLVGTMESPRGADQLCPLPSQGLYYVRLVCRTLPGNAGAASQVGEVSTLVLPGTTDGDAPTASPTPTVTGNVSGVYLTWEPIQNPDPVVYRVYADVVAAVQTDGEHFVGETTGNGLLVVATPGDPPTPLRYDSDTFFRVVAVDGDGPGPNGTVVRGRPIPASGDAIQVTDEQVPSASPTPTVIPGLGVLFLRWTPPLNNDPLSYRVYVSAEPTVPVDTAHLIGEVSGTAFTVKALTDGSALPYDADVYVRLVAVDADGPATNLGEVVAARPLQVTGPDIAVMTVNAENVATHTLTGELLSGTVVLGTTIATGAIDQEPTSPTYGQVLGQRVQLDPHGLRLVDAAGVDIVKFPTDPSEDAFIRAKFITSEMQVLGNMSIEGESNFIATGSTVTLGAGVMPPAVAASPSIDYETSSLTIRAANGSLGLFALSPAFIEAMGVDTSGRLLIAQRASKGIRVWTYTTAGLPVLEDGVPKIRDFGGFSEVRGVWQYSDGPIAIFGKVESRWAVYVRTGPGAITLTYLPTSGQGSLLRPSMANRRPAAYYDEVRTRIIVAEMDAPQPSGGSAIAPNGILLHVYRALANGAIEQTSTLTVAAYSADAEFGSVMTGDFDYGTSGNAKIALNYRDSTSAALVTAVQNNSAVETVNGWPVSGAPRNMTWVPQQGSTPGRFVSVDKAGVLTLHSDWMFSGSPKIYYGHSWYDSDSANGTPTPPTNDKTHETTLGGRGIFVPAKRSRMRLTVPAPPDKGGGDDPDSWRLYAVMGTSAPPKDDLTFSTYRFQQQGTSVTTGFPTSVVLTRIATNGSAPPTVNNFPNASPGRLRSGGYSTKYGRAEFEVDGAGGGQWHRLAPPGLCVPYLGVGGDVDTNLILPEVLPGWLRAIGETASKTAYPALYAIVGDRYNTGGEGTGFFRLPDLRDRSPIGAGIVALGQNEGAAYGSERNDRWSHLHLHGAGTLTTDGPTTLVNREPRTTGSDNTASSTHGHQVKNSTASAGSARHPFLGVTYLVKT